jgi:predicted RNase H-like HicB family nuclease
MEEWSMKSYNLSLIYYPQAGGGYTVICPELRCCVTEGNTKEEARQNILGLIEDFLPDETTNAGELDEQMFREGLCMKGKEFEDIDAEITAVGEVVFPSAKAASVA